MHRITRRAAAIAASVGLAVVIAGCSNTPTAPRVVLPNADSLVLSPDTGRVAIDATFAFTVTAYDSAHVVIAAALAFHSSNPSVFTVDGAGHVRGVGEGAATLTVTSGAAADTAVVFVVAAQRGWFAQISGTTTPLHAVAFAADGAHGWAAGDIGLVLATSDGGTHWAPQASGTTLGLEAVRFTSAAEGWIAGGSGTVLHTTNGGVTWARLSNIASAEDLHGVWFASRDTGWVVGGHGLILRTFDRGATWQRLNRTTSALRSVSFAGTRDGWVVGDNGSILGTHDRGDSWYVVVPSVTAQSLRGVWRNSVPQAAAVGAVGVAPFTVASADTAAWQLGNAGSLFDLRAVCFPIPATGFASGSNGAGVVLRSDDGGATWAPQVVSTLARLDALCFVDAQRGWAVGEQGVILHTVTGGLP